MTKQLPEHARGFRGRAKNIPEQMTILLPYQKKWVEDRHILKFMEKSRRIGISYGTAYERVRTHSQKKHRWDTWVSSRDEATARLFVKDCMIFAKILNVAAKDLGSYVIEKESVNAVKFANDTDLNSLASNPDVFAGKGGDVILDEFALRKDPRGVYAIASPTIDWGGGLQIISTHRGSGNYFNTLSHEIQHKGNPKNFSHHKVTLQDALDQGFLWKLQTVLRDEDPRLHMTEADYFDYQRSRQVDEETFLQEYMCVPSDDSTAFLPYDLIATCELTGDEDLAIETEETVDFAGRKGEIRRLSNMTFDEIAQLRFPLFYGVDIGRDHDLTVIEIVAKIAGILLPVMIIEMKGVAFSRQEAELYPYIGLPMTYRGCIDNTGIGKQFAERAQEKFGIQRVEPVTFTQQMKESLAYPLRTAFEDRRIRVPHDEKTIADLRAIKKTTTDAGNVRFAADRGKNGHADRFWSKALVVHAAGDSNGGPVVVESLSRSKANSARRISKKLEVNINSF